MDKDEGWRWTTQPRIHGVLACLIGALYVLVLVLGVAAFLAPPRISLHLAPTGSAETRVAWVLPGGNLWSLGIRPGDQVLSLDGRRPSPRSVGAWSGQCMVARTAAGTLRPADARAIGHAGYTWPLLLLSPWFLLLGTLVYLRAPRRRIGGAAYGLFTAAAFALALAPGADRNQFLATAAEHIAVPLFAAFYVLFFLTFPTTRGGARARVLILAPAILAGLLGVGELIWPATYGLGVAVWLGILLIYLCLGSALMCFSLVTAREPDARQGLIVVAGGTVLSALPFVTLYLAPKVVGLPPVLSSERAILALAVLPASFAYAILRHHVLPIPLRQRWAMRVLLGAILALLYFAAGVIVRWGFGIAALPSDNTALILVLAALIGLSFRWLYDHAEQVLDRLMFQDGYNYRAALSRLSQELSLASDVEALGATLTERLRHLLNPRFALFLVDGAPASPIGVPAAARALVEAARSVRDGPRTVLLPESGGEVLIIPLQARDSLVGHLCLGPKQSGEPFRPDDQALLATLSGHLAALVHNAQLVRELRDRVEALDRLNARLQRTQEEERRRLAAEIHDEPLQTAVHLQRQLSVGDTPTSQHLALSELLVGQLRAVCLAVRPAVLDELGLPAALEVLALELARHTGIPVQLDADPELEDLALSVEADLILYRAAQEALTNAVRHAHPRELRIILRQRGSAIHLRIADDGSGFAVPFDLDGMAAAGHFGLAGLQQRVRHAGGHLSLTSAPGAGTTVDVCLPFPGTTL